MSHFTLSSLLSFLCLLYLSSSVYSQLPNDNPINNSSNSNGVDSDVRVLTDDNFEHDTQASTGMTTGDWLIEFYAPWCGHCKNLAPTWERVATELKEHQINVAKVDCTQHTATAKRFDIRGYPTIKLLHRGRVYDYEGDRTLDSLIDWTLKISQERIPTASITNQRQMPKPLGQWEQLLDSVATLGYDVEMIALKKPAACVLIAMMGFLLGVLSTLIMMTFCLDASMKPVVLTSKGQIVSPPESPRFTASPTPTVTHSQTESSTTYRNDSVEESEEKHLNSPSQLRQRK